MDPQCRPHSSVDDIERLFWELVRKLKGETVNTVTSFIFIGILMMVLGSLGYPGGTEHVGSATVYAAGSIIVALISVIDSATSRVVAAIKESKTPVAKEPVKNKTP